VRLFYCINGEIFADFSEWLKKPLRLEITGPIFIIVGFPAVGFVYIVNFAFHIFEDFVLQRGELFLPAEHFLIGGQEHIEPDKLPFGDALRFFDIGERVALECPPVVRADFAELAVFTLNHFSTPVKICFLYF
jgi:hypothetical protein